MPIKSLISNNYWKHKVEDNAYVIMRSNKNVVAMLHSTATQWQHQFRVEITLEKALLKLSGILYGSKTYGSEKIEIQPKFSKNKKKISINFKKDLSWKREIDEFVYCIIALSTPLYFKMVIWFCNVPNINYDSC